MITFFLFGTYDIVNKYVGNLLCYTVVQIETI